MRPPRSIPALCLLLLMTRAASAAPSGDGTPPSDDDPVPGEVANVLHDVSGLVENCVYTIWFPADLCERYLEQLKREYLGELPPPIGSC